MYKCNDCGNTFDYLKRVEEPRGEFWGVPCTETMYYCPCCESDDYEYYDEEKEYERWESERY